MRVRSLCIATIILGTAPLVGQADPLAEGIAAMERHDLERARVLLETSVQHVPDSYQANWRLSHVLVDLAKTNPDSLLRVPRDSLYRLAVSYARRAVAANPDGADGHFMLANALGQLSLTLGNREQVKLAIEIRSEALRALGLDPTHSGAYHVMGRWHAEIKRLSAVERFFARAFLGADIFELASWDEAERNMRLATQQDPDRIFHRLDLAKVLIDRDKRDEAREQLEQIGRMPRSEPMDVEYQREAEQLLHRLIERRP